MSITPGQHQIRTAPLADWKFNPHQVPTCPPHILGLEQMLWGICRARRALGSNCLHRSRGKYREGSEMSTSPGNMAKSTTQGRSWEDHHGHWYPGDRDVPEVSVELTNPEISVLHGAQHLLLWHSHPYLLFKSVQWILYSVFNTVHLQMCLKVIPHFLLMCLFHGSLMHI